VIFSFISFPIDILNMVIRYLVKYIFFKSFTSLTRMFIKISVKLSANLNVSKPFLANCDQTRVGAYQVTVTQSEL
jgi:hypothetical protein